MWVESILCDMVKGNNLNSARPLLYDITTCPTKRFMNLQNSALGLKPTVAYGLQSEWMTTFFPQTKGRQLVNEPPGGKTVLVNSNWFFLITSIEHLENIHKPVVENKNHLISHR